MVAVLRNDIICIDPRDLNKVIKREHHPLCAIEGVIAGMPDSQVFSVLVAKSGFLQIKLDEESLTLTTFNTPIGRFRLLRLPFGVKCAPKICQYFMDEMLEGIDRAFSVMDNISIAGKH